MHSPLIGSDYTPPFELVGTEPHGSETWQHLRLKVPEKVDNPSRLPHYWIAVNEKSEPVALRRFAGPVIIKGKVGQAKIDYASSPEPFITPPMMKRN